MHWEYLVQKPSSDSVSLALVPLGSMQAVRDHISTIFGNVEWEIEPSMMELMDRSEDQLRAEGWDDALIEQSRHENSYGQVARNGLQYYFSNLDHCPTFRFLIEIDGEGDPHPLVKKLCEPQGWKLFIQAPEGAWQVADETWDRPNLEKEGSELSRGNRERKQPLGSSASFAYNDPVSLDSALRMCEDQADDRAKEILIEISQSKDFPVMCFPRFCQAALACKVENPTKLALSLLDASTTAEFPNTAIHACELGDPAQVRRWLETQFRSWNQLLPFGLGRLAKRAGLDWPRCEEWIGSSHHALAAIALEWLLECDPAHLDVPQVESTLVALERNNEIPQLQLRIELVQEHLRSATSL